MCESLKVSTVSRTKKRKATKRQSDTTFFAKSAKSAESAKSAKPIFVLNGVGDGSLWVDEYLTNNERISN